MAKNTKTVKKRVVKIEAQGKAFIKASFNVNCSTTYRRKIIKSCISYFYFSFICAFN